MTFVFTVLRNGHASVHTLHMSKPVMKFVQSATEWTCFGTYFTHVQTCDDVRVQSATERTCFGTYFTHVQTCDDVRVHSATERTCVRTYFTHVQTCDDVRVQSATERTASVHTLHMSKPVMTFVFTVLRILFFKTWAHSVSGCDADDRKPLASSDRK